MSLVGYGSESDGDDSDDGTATQPTPVPLYPGVRVWACQRTALWHRSFIYTSLLSSPSSLSHFPPFPLLYIVALAPHPPPSRLRPPCCTDIISAATLLYTRVLACADNGLVQYNHSSDEEGDDANADIKEAEESSTPGTAGAGAAAGGSGSEGAAKVALSTTVASSSAGTDIHPECNIEAGGGAGGGGAGGSGSTVDGDSNSSESRGGNGGMVEGALPKVEGAVDAGLAKKIAQLKTHHKGGLDFQAYVTLKNMLTLP